MSLAAKIQKHIDAAKGEAPGPYFIEDIDVPALSDALEDFRAHFVFPDFTHEPPAFAVPSTRSLHLLGYFRGVEIHSAVDAAPVPLLHLAAKPPPASPPISVGKPRKDKRP